MAERSGRGVLSGDMGAASAERAISPVEADGATTKDQIFATDIPARLDRLPWGRFHTLVVVALGIT